MELDVFFEGLFSIALRYEYRSPPRLKMQHLAHLQSGQREVQQLMQEILLPSGSEHHIYLQIINNDHFLNEKFNNVILSTIPIIILDEKHILTC